MGVTAAVTWAAANVVVGNQDITTPDLGGQLPAAAFFIITKCSAASTPTNHAVLGIGAADASGHQWAMCTSSQHGVTPPVTRRRAMTDECIMAVATTGNVDGEANTVNSIADGWRVNWGNAPAAAYLVGAEFFAGTDLTAEVGTFAVAAAVGNSTDVVLGWVPDAVLFGHHGTVFDDGSHNEAFLSHGVAVNKSPVVQACWQWFSNNGGAAVATTCYLYDHYGIGQGFGGWNGDISFLANGFRCTTRDAVSAGDEVGYLALKFNDAVSFGAGVVDSPIAIAPPPWTVNDPGFEPQIVHMGLSHLQTVDTHIQTGDAGSVGISVFDIDDEYCYSIQEEDAANPSNNQSLADDRAVNLPQDDGTIGHVATDELTDSGWELTFTATLGAARKWWWFALGAMAEEEAEPTPARRVLAYRRHELYLTSDAGVRLGDAEGRNPLATFLELRATRVANGIGWIDVWMPKSFNTDLFLQRDFMIQLWRRPRGGTLSLWRPYFLRKWRFETYEGTRALVLSGPCVNDLLRRRWVIAYAGSAQASKTDYADDMMKEIVTESMSDAVPPTPDAGTRAWANLSVAADLGLGPTVSLDFAFTRLLTHSGGGVLPKIARASRVAGTDLFFDVTVSSVSASDLQLEFRTNTGQPGMNLSDHVLFDESKGNMGNAYYEYDASKEENYVYGVGKGQGTDRNVQQAYDADRYNASIWNRCEGVADARNAESDNAVREAARDRLREGEPVERFGAVPKDTRETKYGIHWNWGDKVKARYAGKEFISIVRSVVLWVGKDGNEQVTSRLDYISDV